ncbi:hypothetical protein SAMN06265348_110264 [Pedobacter westerhofensis]|uniref:Uncharacterized protein n=1 Tax=Pedobacter westerhofensis TaxID=425512 RepID=A0A521F9U3_9SPHI|nr:hypothetical protein [Pedobacter westerhofensis]SMO92260.1 hypothetical protein SAMN06265348_110264 [Pedobacter westerhofensis]
MSKTTYFTLMWLILSAILYAICSFIEWDYMIDKWSMTIRAIFGIGTLALGVWSIYCCDKAK